MRVTAAAEHLGATHSVAGIALHLYVLGSDGLIVARPAGTGMVLRFRAEERLTAADAEVSSGRFGVLILAGEGRLGALLPRDVILLIGEIGSPFGIALSYLVGHGR